MSDPSASTEPVPADSESTPSLASGGKGNGDTGGRAVALVIGVLVGTCIGVGIGIGIGNATRKQLDRWTISY